MNESEPGRAAGSRPRVLLALALAAALAASLAGCAPAPQPLAPPNVLFIVIDCLRSDHVGSYGYERPTTPNLDHHVAAAGTVFERAYSQAQWTRPSLVSYLTGLYPSEHGLLEVERDAEGRITGPALADEAVTIAEQFQAAGYATMMIGEQFQLSKTFNLHQGFDFYRNRAGKASQIGRSALRWFDRLEPERPFFAYLHYLDIHWPYCPPKRFRDRFDPGESTLANCYQWAELRSRIRSGEQQLSPADITRLEARYDEELLSVDASFGTLFPELMRRGLWDETLVIVTSDHGEEFMEHGSIGHQGGLWDVVLSVPLIVKPPAGWPGVPTPRVSEPVELRSIVATLRQAIGAPPGAGGPSLVPYLLGETPEEAPAYAISESSDEIRVRTATHSLIVGKGDGSRRLFDRSAEPLERTDLSAERPELVAGLTQVLRRWRDGLEPVTPADVEVDEETIEGLRALGYID